MARRDVIEAIKALEDAEGRLTAEQVVDAARDPGSPLHGCFIWDDNRAAEEYRLDQARRLITSIELRLRYEKFELNVPNYIRDPVVPANEQGYRATLRVRSEYEQAHEALVAEMARAAALLKRARHLALALGMAEEVEAIERQVAGFTESLRPEAPEPAPEPPPPPRRGRRRERHAAQ